MVIEINFPPYDRAEIIGMNEDGSVLCNLYGAQHEDTDICFPAGSGILGLGPDQVDELMDINGIGQFIVPDIPEV